MSWFDHLFSALVSLVLVAAALALFVHAAATAGWIESPWAVEGRTHVLHIPAPVDPNITLHGPARVPATP